MFSSCVSKTLLVVFRAERATCGANRFIISAKLLPTSSRETLSLFGITAEYVTTVDDSVMRRGGVVDGPQDGAVDGTSVGRGEGTAEGLKVGVTDGVRDGGRDIVGPVVESDSCSDDLAVSSPNGSRT